jgi:RimJ/RimL family protein N-acetyltransferase
MSNPPILETPRLILRAAEKSDYDAAFAMWSDPDVVRYIGGNTRSSVEVWSAIARGRGCWPLLGYGFWIVTDKNNGAFLGEAGFADFKRGMDPDLSAFPEAGWAFTAASWGKGIGREAVGAMHNWMDQAAPQDTVCIIDASNVASQKIARSLGYDVWCESTLRDAPITVYRRKPAVA